MLSSPFCVTKPEGSVLAIHPGVDLLGQGYKRKHLTLKEIVRNSFPRAAPIFTQQRYAQGPCSTLEQVLSSKYIQKIVFLIGLDSHFPSYNVNWPYATHFCKIPAMAFVCAFPGLKFSINF